MSAQQFTNNATTTLGSSLASSATTCTVATGTGALFPTLSTSQFFKATLIAAGNTVGTPNEIVEVTARTGDTMTIVRGQEGTTAVNWNVGDTFMLDLTAAFLTNLAQQADVQQQLGNSADDTGTANAGVITLSPAPASLSAILLAPIRVLKINAANNATGYTLNANGLGAESVVYQGSALTAGMLLANEIFEVAWDGTYWELLSNPGVLAPTSVVSGSYTNMNATVGADGRIEAASNGAAAFTPTYASFQLQESSGTASPESLTGNFWTTRLLNTSVFNSIAGCSLSSNTISLTTLGTYEFSILAPISRYGVTAQGQARLMNTTASSVALIGTSVSVGAPYEAYSVAWSQILGQVTITVASNFIIQTWATGATQGGGVAASTGGNEVYTSCYIRRLA